MDRNICENGKATDKDNSCLVAWYAESNDNTKGPITAMNSLYNATKNWYNVPNMNLDYEDEGRKEAIDNNSEEVYGYNEIKILNVKITIISSDNEEIKIDLDNLGSIKACLPKKNEVSGKNGTYCTHEDGTCPVWLVENLAYLDNKITYGDNVVKLGDVNLDGNITSDDYELILSYLGLLTNISQLQC